MDRIKGAAAGLFGNPRRRAARCGVKVHQRKRVEVFGEVSFCGERIGGIEQSCQVSPHFHFGKATGHQYRVGCQK